MRVVSPTRNREGLFELGPCVDAPGLGDTLCITPLAAALGNKAVMLLPKSMEHFAFLFHELCPVRIVDSPPVFPWKTKHASKQKLDMFGLSGVSPLPVVKLRPEIIQQGRAALAGICNPIAFTPTCSKGWEHIRQRPARFWEPVVAELSKRFSVCQFGRRDYPTVPGARRMPFVNLELLAGIYHHLGNYVGVNTGDYHLMLAVGGRCVIAEPDPMPSYQAQIWWYDTPRVVYGKLSHPSTVLEAIKRLPL